MTTQVETTAPVSGTLPKLQRLLRKRLRQLARVMLVVAIGLLIGATALAIWWLTSLSGLPDIGDPFDVAAFRASRIADDQNAFTFLRRANKMLTPRPKLSHAVAMSVDTVSWATADPKLRAWVDANRQALEVFQQGAGKSDAIQDLVRDPLGLYGGVNPYELTVLALLEGSKRQESGNMTGAWDCYRAVLRMTALDSRRRLTDDRRASDRCRRLHERLTTWAADPRTTLPQLRRALDEALKAEPMREWDSFAMKMGYLEIMYMLGRPMREHEQQLVEGEWTYRLGDMQLSTDIVESIKAARRVLLREPERSRHVVRLLWANWLAHVETGEQSSRKPAVRAFLPAVRPVSVPVYPVGPDAPAGARALSPRELASWLLATRDAKLIMEEGDLSVVLRHRMYERAHRDLVVMLATEIYHRQRGALPSSEEALVGTYLKSLPTDGSADLAGETTPTVK
jgi:hypothetical protein